MTDQERARLLESILRVLQNPGFQRWAEEPVLEFCEPVHRLNPPVVRRIFISSR